MPWTATFSERLQVVEVVCQGTITPEDLRQQTVQSLTLCQRHGTDQFLIDAHQLKSAFTVFDVMGVVDAFRELGAPQPGRTAVVLPVSADSARTLRFFETVARNRTYDVRVFNRRAEAEAWLLAGRGLGPAGAGERPENGPPSLPA